MQRYALAIPFSFGKANIQVSLDGQYANLDSESDDRLREAIVASLLQLPTWLKASIRTSPAFREGSRDSSGDNEAMAKIQNGSGVIDVRLTIEEKQGDTPQDIIQRVANATAASVQNHGDAALTGMPATNDTLVQVYRYLSASRQPVSAGQGENGNQR